MNVANKLAGELVFTLTRYSNGNWLLSLVSVEENYAQ